MITLSILIVTWNSQDVIYQCLRSIELDSLPIEYKVYVADNASVDGTVEIIKNYFPAVDIVINKYNIGFGAANNQLIRRCNSDIILFLNPDTILQRRSIQLMINHFNQDKSVGVVGPRLINRNGSPQLIDMRFPKWITPVMDSIFLKKALGINDGLRLVRSNLPSTNAFEVDWVMGACLMTKRGILEDVGYFDEQYFLFCEEMDLCYRIKQKGWKVVYLSQSTVVHLGGIGIDLYDSRKIYEIHKSQLLFFQKIYSKKDYMLLKTAYIIKAVLRIAQWQVAYLELSRLSIEKIKGYFMVLRYLMPLSAKKKYI